VFTAFETLEQRLKRALYIFGLFAQHLHQFCRMQFCAASPEAYTQRQHKQGLTLCVVFHMTTAIEVVFMAHTQFAHHLTADYTKWGHAF